METHDHQHQRGDVTRSEPGTSLDQLGRTNYLARAVRSGSRESFEELFQRVMPALLVWTRMRTRGAGGTALDPQDVLQEVWLRALRSFDAFDTARSFRGWILGIAKNVVLENLRRPGARELPRRAEAGSEGDAEQVPDSVSSVGNRLARDESLEQLLAFVDALEPAERSLVLYCGIEEYTSAEAADRLGISAEAASQRWLRLRARMQGNAQLAGLAAGLFG